MQCGSLAARLRRSAALGAILTAVCVPAFAQNVPLQTVETTQPTPTDDADEGERIVVTGTRLTNQFTSASPMDVVTTEEATAQGFSDVAQLLRNSTVAAGSPQITAITSTAFVTEGGTGAETLSLRGLGASRTLVLLDGRRAGPAGTRGSVGAFDLNVIPLSAIERVEILKEGASSIYGSDAVAGVVNIITKKDDGADFDAFYSMPLAGGGDEFRLSGSWGETFNNLRVRITGDYYKQEELQRGDRDFFQCASAYVFNPDGSRADIVDPRTGRFVCEGDSPWGHVWFYDYNEAGAISRPWQARPQLIQFNRGNDLQNYLPGFGPTTNPLTVPAGWFPVGYGEIVTDPDATPDPFYAPSANVSDALVDLFHPFQNLVSLSPQIERMTAFAQGEYDVNDSLQLYAEALLNRRTTIRHSYRQFWTYQYVYDYGGGNFIGDPLAISQGWTGSFVGFSPLSITDHAGETVSVDYMRFVAGARGDLPILNGWQWDAAVQFSRSDGDYKDAVIFADAVTDQEFRTSLCAGTLTRYRGAPCVDINWYDPDFLAGKFTPQERAFLFGTVKGNTVYEQTSFEAYVTGDLFQLPAGPVSAVFGGLYQEDSLEDVPSQVIQDAEAWGDSTAGITAGEDTTTAIYTEFAIPILSGVTFFDDLSLNLSGRYNDVESYGEQSTYKVGLNWQVTPSFRIRASQGTSFRSPALFELFLFRETGFQRQTDIDPCVEWADNLASGGITQRIADNCAADGIPDNYNGAGATATIISSGGFGTLEAETSESKSLGVIWTPDFVDLQVSLDYYDIEVEDEVTKLDEFNILFGCYNSPNFATEPLCDLFTRSPAGQSDQYNILEVTDNYLNIATQKTRGLDLDMQYTHTLPWGDLTLHGQVSHQLEDEIVLLPGDEPLDLNGLMGDPKWVGNFNATLDMEPFSFFYGLRYVGETSNEESYGAQPQTYRGQNVRYVLSSDAVVYHDVSVSVEPTEGLTVRLGVSNLLDEEPPQVTGELSGEYDTVGNIPVGDASQYDYFGRTVFLNVSKSF
jgi:iron complex outermembrane receptor protein